MTYFWCTRQLQMSLLQGVNLNMQKSKRASLGIVKNASAYTRARVSTSAYKRSMAWTEGCSSESLKHCWTRSQSQAWLNNMCCNRRCFRLRNTQALVTSCVTTRAGAAAGRSQSPGHASANASSVSWIPHGNTEGIFMSEAVNVVGAMLRSWGPR